MKNNSIHTILTYRYAGGWVFDDARVGLDHEAFVAGADDLIERLAEGADTVTLNFATIPFPGHQLTLRGIKGDKTTGTDYHCEEMNADLWLCPALNLYYDVSPEVIYVQFKANKAQ